MSHVTHYLSAFLFSVMVEILQILQSQCISFGALLPSTEAYY